MLICQCLHVLVQRVLSAIFTVTVFHGRCWDHKQQLFHGEIPIRDHLLQRPAKWYTWIGPRKVGLTITLYISVSKDFSDYHSLSASIFKAWTIPNSPLVMLVSGYVKKMIKQHDNYWNFQRKFFMLKMKIKCSQKRNCIFVLICR